MSSSSTSGADTSWLPAREALVEQALIKEDYEALKRISALPGGFGGDDMRRKVWPVLLRTAQYFPSEGESSRNVKADEPHQDEAQVKLDTDRSFVLYPKGIPSAKKQAMQDDLEHLIVTTLRAYPKLNYFQGYHDIMSVLYLSLATPLGGHPSSQACHTPDSDRQREEHSRFRGQDSSQYLSQQLSDRARNSSEWRELRECAAAVSLYRVRDAMGKGMDGMMGWLKLLKRILRTSDPDLARFSNVISPVPTLPFFALSWILCLFSHDIDTLEPVQRMFDFLLARNPVSALYLAVAILVTKKPEMYALARKLGPEAMDDPSLLHPLFARLPPLFADVPSQPCPPAVTQTDADHDDAPNPYTPIALSELFALTDTLMTKYPWSGKEIRGHEIMGPGSVINTYAQEEAANVPSMTPYQALDCIDVDVVRPGATEVDPEDESLVALPPRPSLRRFLRVSRSRLGTLVAFGVLLVGIGIATYSPRRNNPLALSGAFWASAIRRWAIRVHSHIVDRLGSM